MRLWTLHPKYLDNKGLVALWRESLLAQAVLKGQTKGYTQHPQLIRFRESNSPGESIAFYLQCVYAEAQQRGFNFDSTKFTPVVQTDLIKVAAGQLDYEWNHLRGKLKKRDPALYSQLSPVIKPSQHPLFIIVPGPIASWEIT